MNTSRQPSNHREEEKDSLGSDSDRRSVDPASMSEDEEGDDANEKLVDEVKEAKHCKQNEAWIQIEFATIHGFHLY